MNIAEKDNLPHAGNGFTLVELMVALFVFSLISVAGVALLRSSADGQIVLKNRLSDHSVLMRTSNLLESDLAQAVPRRVRDVSGVNLPVFTANNPISGQSGQALFSFTRTGLTAGNNDGGSAIGRVAYSFANGALQRTSWRVADGSERVPPAIMLEELKSVTARFRNISGEWRSDWSAIDPDEMPRAVELTITPKSAAPYRLVVLVGGQVRPQPAPANNNEEG